MTLQTEDVADATPRETPSPVRFLDAAARAGLGGAATLVLRLERIGASARGRLADVIDEAMERELAARGAASPGIGSSSDADAALSDQLFRARQVGVRRVCLALGPLRAAASTSGAMEAEDSRTLLFWAKATRDRPVELVLDEGDEKTGAYVAPVPLSTALAAARGSASRGSTRTATTTPTPTPTPTEMTPTATDRQIAGASIATDETWRSFTLALSAARGPQSLAAFEKLFTQSYVPLCHAIEGGLADPRAVHARDEFRATFVRMYVEACPTFAATGKRPKMVFDAPDLAARMARLHGARTVHLLLASGMRFDLGACVKEELTARLGATAALTDETLLWSALPTTTERQLDCLARGADALRGPFSSDHELEPVRGRTAEAIRRVKIGSRDVYKLDLGDAKIREAGPGAHGAIRKVAQSLADAIAKHAKSLPPRTLLFVFGDHGFAIDAAGVASSGGAAPEEVLAPAFAFLMGEVH
jgi:hypothetical protein